MWSETRRPDYMEDVIGHTDVKASLRSYLSTPPYTNVILLHGPPGIGKTTIALAATRSCGMETLEINASQSMRSFADVDTLIQSCSHTRSISSLIRGDKKHTCLILDEIDGSDPHAQRKLAEWMTGSGRKVPVLMTCNEIPKVFKQREGVDVLRCYPPKACELQALFPNEDVVKLAKRFKHDVRRMTQYLQYGESDTLPVVTQPSECTPEVYSILKQKMFVSSDPILVAMGSNVT